MHFRFPSFRDYDMLGRKQPYGWDYGHGSTRKRITFETKKQKADFRRAFSEKWFSDRNAFVEFDPAKWRKFLTLEEMAGGMDALERGAAYVSKNQGALSPLFSEAAKAKIDNLNRIDSPTIKRVETYCRRFINALGDRSLDTYSASEIQAWIDVLRKEHGLNSIKNHHKTIASVFNLAIRVGDLNRSPAQHITFPSSRGEKRQDILSPEDIERLLHHIWNQDKAMASIYGLLFFTGLRVSMIAPDPKKRARSEFIRSDMIDAEKRTIIIPAGIMKAENALIIDEYLAPPNLWAWLEHIDKARIPIASQTFTNFRNKFCKAAGVRWPANVHRRSCASYMSAMLGKDIAADLLGNSSDMIVKHYKVNSFRETAKAFTGIYPPIAGAACPWKR